jgi:hypothetical protein
MATVSAFLLAKPPTNKPHAISRVLICSINSVQDVRRKITQNGTFRSIGRNFKFVVIGKEEEDRRVKDGWLRKHGTGLFTGL